MMKYDPVDFFELVLKKGEVEQVEILPVSDFQFDDFVVVRTKMGTDTFLELGTAWLQSMFKRGMVRGLVYDFDAIVPHATLLPALHDEEIRLEFFNRVEGMKPDRWAQYRLKNVVSDYMKRCLLDNGIDLSAFGLEPKPVPKMETGKVEVVPAVFKEIIDVPFGQLSLF